MGAGKRPFTEGNEVNEEEEESFLVIFVIFCSNLETSGVLQRNRSERPPLNCHVP